MYCTLYGSKCCTNLIKSPEIKNNILYVQTIVAGSLPKRWSSVEARRLVAVVHADRVHQAGKAGLRVQTGDGGLCVALLGAAGALRVGCRPVAGRHACLWGFLSELHGGQLQELRHSGWLAWTVEQRLALLLLKALLLTGFFHITVMCTGKKQCDIYNPLNA